MRVINFGNLSKEIFETLKAFDYDLIMYDADGGIVHEPTDARRYFDKGEDLMITMLEDGENSSVTLTRSEKIQMTEILSLVETLKQIVDKYSLIWNLRGYGGKIKPTNFSRSVSESRKEFMDLTEHMYGTSKSSYLKLENARLIVKHSDRVDEKAFGARSRKIDRIFVENDRGERFLLPTNQLLPGRAMAQHVSNGGTVSDEIGDHIKRMASAYRDLGTCIRHVRRHMDVLPESACEVSDNARTKRHHIRRMFERLYRNYDKASVELADDQMITEMAAEALQEAMDTLRGSICAEGAELDDGVLESLAQVIRYGDEEPLVEIEPDFVKESGNAIFKEHMNWLSGFDPDVILTEDDELTWEDVIMPKNSSPDLKHEVVKTKPSKPRMLADADRMNKAK